VEANVSEFALVRCWSQVYIVWVL